MNRIAIIIIIAMNSVIVSLVLWQINSKPKFAYVDVGSLYENFTLKKELSSKLDNTSSTRKSILDSLELKIKVIANALNTDASVSQKAKEELYAEYETMRQEYVTDEKDFGQDNDRMKAQFNEQIWKQLNQYIKEYGKENGYEYIFGADGSGALMYGNEVQNITETLKGYVNSKYSGHKSAV